MPAWPGGPCPNCGDDMPENLVHCQTCRALLNDDFDISSVEIPTFVPLQEIATVFDVAPVGYFLPCPKCKEELRINAKYLGEHVQCKLCHTGFRFDISNSSIRVFSAYMTCPHCSQELRAAGKYLGAKVACKFCGGQIQLVDAHSQSRR